MSTLFNMRTPWKSFSPGLGAALLAMLLLNACAVNPATGRGNFVLTSERKEIEIGKEEHEKVLQSMALYEDEKVLAYVREVGQRVAAVSHRPDLEYHFFVIDSPEINAFALPGGYVYMNRGLLTYLNSEAELAAVLAHEIGHITARHAIQQQGRGVLANTAANVGGFVAAVATGSGFIGSQIAEVSSLWAAAGLSGFGREHELEADSLGAEYLAKAGYDSKAMIGVLTVLKNQEDFNVKVANRQPRYHGLFSTHPRNDTRLQQAITLAGNEAGDQQPRPVDHAVFRDKMNGLVVGQSQSSAAQTRNRYYQTLLGYTMVFPDDWEIAETPTTVTAAAPDSTATIKVEAQRLQVNKEPRLFIREDLGITALQQSEELNQYRLRGYTGTHTNAAGNPERVAVIYFGPRVFTIRGELLSAEDEQAMDQLLLASARTFRAIQANERMDSTEMKIRYVQTTESFSFDQLARISRLPEYPEETLRLLNAYYPIGTPRPGEWIKIVE